MDETTFDVVMEYVCEMCHWPYVCEAGKLDEKCENCPAECAIRAALEGR